METIPYEYRNLPVNREGPFGDLYYNLCIACGRCVRACRDFRGVHVLDFTILDGYSVAGPSKGNHKDSGCKFCFTCVEVCPTGALVDRAARYHSITEWEEYVVPCGDACPAHIDIPRYVKLIAQGKYSEYVSEGIGLGRRPDLVGGGLIRSLGGWSEARKLGKSEKRLKGDERILGDSQFVLDTLQETEERFERKYELKARGYDLKTLGERVEQIFKMEPGEIYSLGKYKRLIKQVFFGGCGLPAG